MSKTDDIEHAIKLLNEGYARGLVPEETYVREDARLRARQAEIRDWRERRAREPSQPRLALPRRPIRADLSTRFLRRRGLAYGGMLPPAIAKSFTVGQAAVLTVLAWEVLHHGACRKSLAEIADEAGCSRRWARATIKFAATAGVVDVERRPRPGRKDETNVVRIVETTWLDWIKVRRERQEAARRASSARSIGGSGLPSLPNGSSSRRDFATRERPPFPLESPSRGFQRSDSG